MSDQNHVPTTTVEFQFALFSQFQTPVPLQAVHFYNFLIVFLTKASGKFLIKRVLHLAAFNIYLEFSLKSESQKVTLFLSVTIRIGSMLVGHVTMAAYRISYLKQTKASFPNRQKRIQEQLFCMNVSIYEKDNIDIMLEIRSIIITHVSF